jgi:hypothetical protein
MESSLNMIPSGLDALTIHLFHSSMNSLVFVREMYCLGGCKHLQKEFCYGVSGVPKRYLRYIRFSLIFIMLLIN